MDPKRVSFTVAALVMVQTVVAIGQAPSQSDLGRQWQQRAKAAIAAMDQEIVNERELAGGRLLTQMVKTGDVAAAVALAESMSTSRLNALLQIGNRLVAAGQSEAARRVVPSIEKALAEALAKDSKADSKLASNLRSLAGIYGGLGDFDQARQTASRITPKMDEPSLHITGQGTVRVPGGTNRGASLWDISLNQIDRGDIEAAKRTMNEITLRPMREAALWTAVKRLASTGHSDQARAFAREIPPCDFAGKFCLFLSPEGPEERDVKSFQTDAYEAIALKQAESKDLKAAQATLRFIPPLRHPALVLAFTRILITQGAYAEALEAAKWQNDSELTRWVLAGTARHQAETGKLMAAVATAKPLTGPQRAFALLAIAERQVRDKDFAAAKQSIDELYSTLADDPTTIRMEALVKGANLLVDCGDPVSAQNRLAEAESIVQNLSEVNEQQQWRLVIATGYEKAGDRQHAQAEIAKIALPGRAAHAWVEVAKRQVAKGERGVALASLKNALQQAKLETVAMPLDWPQSKPHNLRDIGRAMVALNMSTELEAIVAAESNSLVKAYLCLGAAEGDEPDIRQHVGGLPPYALQDFTAAVRLTPDFAMAYNDRGMIKHQQGEFDAALKDFTESLRLDQSLPMAYSNRGHVWLAKGNLDAALKDFNETIRIEPKAAIAYYARGQIRYAKRDLDGALGDFTETIRLQQQLSIGYHARARVLVEKAELEAALKDYDEAIRIDPKFTMAYLDRGATWQAQGQFANAVKDFTEAIRLAPQEAGAYYSRGSALHATGELDNAQRDFTEAIRLEPKEAKSYYSRALVWQSKGDLDAAIKDNTEAIRLDPKFAMAYNNRGNVYQAKGERDAAVEDYNQAIRLDPTIAIAYHNRGNVLQLKGDLDAALQDYTQAIHIDPKFAMAFLSRGNVSQAKGNLDAALKDYADAVRLDPKFVAAYNLRAWLLATASNDRIRNGKQAIEDATKACELMNWKDSAALDTLAAAYAEGGRFEDAVKWQEKALKLAPQANKAELESRLGLYRANKPFRQPMKAH